MDINNKLYDALDNNESIKENFKDQDYSNSIRISLANDIKNVKNHIYRPYIKDFELSDDVIDIIENMTVRHVNDDEVSVDYDINTNTLSFGNSKKDMEYHILKSMIKLTSQRYDQNKNRVCGIITEDDKGIKIFEKENDIIIDKLILYTTGISQTEENEDLYSITRKQEIRALNDEKYFEMEKIVGVDNLVRYFAYAHGDELFRKLFQHEIDEQIKI